MTTKKRKIFIQIIFEKKMQTKLLNEVVGEIAGKQASDILVLLIGKKDVNEFLLAKKLKLTINQVRNILYKLSNFSLVTFTRKKDKRKGWYTYFWTLDDEKALELLDNRLKKEILSFQQQLKSRQEKRFYICKTCKAEVSEETALLHDFTCIECGEVYELAEKKKTINELRNNIARLEKQRESVSDELEKIKEVREKKIAREARKEERKKARKKKVKKKAKKRGKRIKKKARKKKIKKIKKTRR